MNSFPIIEETRKKHLFFFSLCLAPSYVDNLILFNLFRYTNEKYTEEHPKRQKCPKRTFWQQFLGHIVSTYGTLFGMHYPPRANLIWAVVVAQRSAAVRNLSSANFKLNIYCCQLYWKYQNNEIKEAGNGPFKKKHLFTLSGYELGTNVSVALPTDHLAIFFSTQRIWILKKPLLFPKNNSWDLFILEIFWYQDIKFSNKFGSTIIYPKFI